MFKLGVFRRNCVSVASPFVAEWSGCLNCVLTAIETRTRAPIFFPVEETIVRPDYGLVDFLVVRWGGWLIR